MKRLTVIVVATLAACSSTGVDDTNPAFRGMVDTLRSDGDCAGLQGAFDRTDDADELSYIDAAMRRIGCYD